MSRLLCAALICLPCISNAGGVPLNQSILNALDGKGLSMHCFGTEPFWSLTFAKNPNNTVTLARPGEADQTMPFTYSAQNGGGLVKSVFATSGGISGDITYVPNGNCSDGMSDFGYSFSTSVTFPASTPLGTQQGCCKLQPN